MTSEGLVSGWNIKDVAVDYNAQTDTLYVGVQTYGVAGNSWGGGTPPAGSPGTNPANFGGDKAMAVAFAPLTGTYNALNLPTPVVVAGVSGDQSQRGTGLDGFTVASYAGGTAPGTIDLVTGFGKTLTAAAGSISPSTPALKIPASSSRSRTSASCSGANPANGFVVMTQDGSDDAVGVGNDQLVGVVPVFGAQQIPEPATWMVWAGLAAGLAWRRLRSRRPIA